jgi:hypothetical protein
LRRTAFVVVQVSVLRSNPLKTKADTMARDEADYEAEKKIESVNNHPQITTTNLRRMSAHIRLFVTPFVDGTPESKPVQQMIHPTSCQKRNSPSPTLRGGKLEGGSSHDQAYLPAERNMLYCHS